MPPRPLRASYASRAILKVGILWLAASTSATATDTATNHLVEGYALSRLRDLVVAKDTGALYDFLNRSWLRGDIDATPDIEALALAVIRDPANDRDDAVNELLSVLGDQPLEAQVDLDAVERAIMTTPLYHEFNRQKIKTSLERQRELADRGTHYVLQNLCDAIERGDLQSVQALMEHGVDPNAVTVPWGKTYGSQIPGGTTLLNLAVQRDKTDVVKFLLTKGSRRQPRRQQRCRTSATASRGLTESR